jgi:hypothetical protein
MHGFLVSPLQQAMNQDSKCGAKEEAAAKAAAKEKEKAVARAASLETAQNALAEAAAKVAAAGGSTDYIAKLQRWMNPS